MLYIYKKGPINKYSINGQKLPHLSAKSQATSSFLTAQSHSLVHAQLVPPIRKSLTPQQQKVPRRLGTRMAFLKEKRPQLEKSVRCFRGLVELSSLEMRTGGLVELSPL